VCQKYFLSGKENFSLFQSNLVYLVLSIAVCD